MGGRPLLPYRDCNCIVIKSRNPIGSRIKLFCFDWMKFSGCRSRNCNCNWFCLLIGRSCGNCNCGNSEFCLVRHEKFCFLIGCPYRSGNCAVIQWVSHSYEIGSMCKKNMWQVQQMLYLITLSLNKPFPRRVNRYFYEFKNRFCWSPCSFKNLPN